MAVDILPSTTGLTVKGYYLNPANGQVLNGSSFEAWNNAHYLSYLVTATEQGTSGTYEMTTPAAVAALPSYAFIFVKSTGALATDTKLGSGGGENQTIKIGTNSADSPNAQTAQTATTEIAADVDLIESTTAATKATLDAVTLVAGATYTPLIQTGVAATLTVVFAVQIDTGAAGTTYVFNADPSVPANQSPANWTGGGTLSATWVFTYDAASSQTNPGFGVGTLVDIDSNPAVIVSQTFVAGSNQQDRLTLVADSGTYILNGTGPATLNWNDNANAIRNCGIFSNPVTVTQTVNSLPTQTFIIEWYDGNPGSQVTVDGSGLVYSAPGAKLAGVQSATAVTTMQAGLMRAGAVTGVILHTGTAQAGSTSTTIKFDTGASAINGTYNNCTVAITAGTGAGQSAAITGYVGATRVATVASPWATTPDGTSVFDVLPGSGGGGSSPVSITINAETISRQ